jgi:hypothetical protein
MSLFEHVIGAKTNFCRTDKNNTLSGENTFNGIVNLNGAVNGLEISDIQNLQSELEERATIIQLDSETEQRIASDTQLQTNIDSVQTNLNNETISRADADDTLQTNIDVVQLNLDNETTDRANSDNNLSNQLQLETLNRTSADATLTTNLTTEETARIAGDATLTTNLTNEETARIAGDATLTTNLTNEETARINADTTLQANIDLKSNIASPIFSGTVKIEKADNYGQIVLTDTTSAGAGVGGGITFNGVYGGGGQSTALANIKAKKSNGTIGDYHGDLSLSVREDGGGGYTEVIKLRGEDLKTIVSGSMEVSGNINLTTGSEFQINGTAISGGGGGIIKERFSRYTLGQTVSTSQGNITLPNVTTELTNTGSSQSWIELTGSNINYTPPANSSIVEYELSFYVYSSGTQDSGIGLQFYIDNVAQTITRAKQPLNEGGTSTWGQMRYSFKTTIEINGTTDASKCWVNTWNTSKNLKLRVSKLNSATMSFHRVAVLLTDNPVQNTDTIIAPLLTITAY